MTVLFGEHVDLDTKWIKHLVHLWLASCLSHLPFRTSLLFSILCNFFCVYNLLHDHPDASFCSVVFWLFLSVCYLVTRTTLTAHTCGWTLAAWHAYTVFPESFPTPLCIHTCMSTRAPPAYWLHVLILAYISFRLPFSYIQTQECLVFN